MRIEKAVFSLAFLAFLALAKGQIAPEDFDLDKHPGYAVLIPRIGVALKRAWGPVNSDVTMIVRGAVAMISGWFDALAPFTAKTKGKSRGQVSDWQSATLPQISCKVGKM